MASSPFLRLPLKLRQKVYSYLLAPYPEEDAVTINYSLEWPFLDNPRNNTFTAHHLDRCHCPQQQPRLGNVQTKDHIYSRYVCQGPNVCFTPKHGDLWLLQKPNGPFNILRPASDEERQRRASTSIIFVSKLLYQEAIPLLYRDRNFLFLSGPCPRGRYQAYATQTWLSRLSSSARKGITTLSLINQVWEEDCQASNALRAYASLALYILEKVPGFRELCLNYLSNELPLHPFEILFRREGVRIFVQLDFKAEDVSMFSDAHTFQSVFGAESLVNVGHKKHAAYCQALYHEPRPEQTADAGRDHDGETTATVTGDTDTCGDSEPSMKPVLSDGIKETAALEDANLNGDRIAQRKFCLGDDWVLTGSSPTESNRSESDTWEML